jgi:hypothetical protein
VVKDTSTTSGGSAQFKARRAVGTPCPAAPAPCP